VCGDFLGGAGVEGAWLSAQALIESVLDRVATAHAQQIPADLPVVERPHRDHSDVRRPDGTTHRALRRRVSAVPREIGIYRGLQSDTPVCFADVSDASQALPPGTTREQLLARFHVRDADGGC